MNLISLEEYQLKAWDYYRLLIASLDVWLDDGLNYSDISMAVPDDDLEALDGIDGIKRKVEKGKLVRIFMDVLRDNAWAHNSTVDENRLILAKWLIESGLLVAWKDNPQQAYHEFARQYLGISEAESASLDKNAVEVEEKTAAEARSLDSSHIGILTSSGLDLINQWRVSEETTSESSRDSWADSSQDESPYEHEVKQNLEEYSSYGSEQTEENSKSSPEMNHYQEEKQSDFSALENSASQNDDVTIPERPKKPKSRFASGRPAPREYNVLSHNEDPLAKLGASDALSKIEVQDGKLVTGDSRPAPKKLKPEAEEAQSSEAVEEIKQTQPEKPFKPGFGQPRAAAPEDSGTARLNRLTAKDAPTKPKVNSPSNIGPTTDVKLDPLAQLKQQSRQKRQESEPRQERSGSVETANPLRRITSGTRDYTMRGPLAGETKSSKSTNEGHSSSHRISLTVDGQSVQLDIPEFYFQQLLNEHGSLEQVYAALIQSLRKGVSNNKPSE